MVMNAAIWEANKTQELIADAVFSDIYRYILCGGSIRSGKTIGCLEVGYVLCKIFPGSRWAVIRESLPTLRRTTLPSFWRTCPQPFFHTTRFNRQDMVATAANGSEILFISESISDDPDLLRFGGLEVNGFILEQAEEVQPKTYYKCIERAGSWNINPMPPPLVLLNCNPHQGYLKKEFYTPYTAGKLKAPYLFIPALIEHNKKNLSPAYLESLEQLAVKAPGLYRRMILGSWDAEDSLDQLISWNTLYACEKARVIPEILDANGKPFPRTPVKSLGVDVGRFGPDSTVLEYMEDFNHVDCLKIDKTDMVEVADVTKKWILEKNIPHDRVFMDTVGMGGGPYDILKKAGFHIQEFIAGAKAIEQYTEGGFKFKDMNTQAAWNMKLGLESGKGGNISDEELRQDLGAYAYEVAGDKQIRMLSKDEIKKRIHRSPDWGDAYKMAYWGQIYDTITPMPDFIVI